MNDLSKYPTYKRGGCVKNSPERNPMDVVNRYMEDDIVRDLTDVEGEVNTCKTGSDEICPHHSTYHWESFYTGTRLEVSDTYIRINLFYMNVYINKISRDSTLGRSNRLTRDLGYLL